MKIRELINIPINIEFEFSDGIWNYFMKKTQLEDGSYIYKWQVSGNINEYFFMFFERQFDEESNRNFDKLFQGKKIGGFWIYSKMEYYQISKLKLINKNCLTDFLKTH
jgi:hypothetical protein